MLIVGFSQTHIKAITQAIAIYASNYTTQAIVIGLASQTDAKNRKKIDGHWSVVNSIDYEEMYFTYITARISTKLQFTWESLYDKDWPK